MTFPFSDNPSRKELNQFVTQWLKANVLGKIITASNGKKIRFNSVQSVKHLTHDGQRGILEAKAITKVLEVFQTGHYKGREALYKPRSDFVAFHAYQKWVDIDEFALLLEAKAGEKENKHLEALPFDAVAYSQHIKEKTTLPAFQSVEVVNDQAGKFKVGGFQGDNNLILDNTQAQTALLTILAIKPLKNARQKLLDSIMRRWFFV